VSDAILAGGIVAVLIAGFWFTRGARGPAPGENQQRAIDTDAHFGPTGEPMDWESRDDPPRQ